MSVTAEIRAPTRAAAAPPPCRAAPVPRRALTPQMEAATRLTTDSLFKPYCSIIAQYIS